MTGIRWGYWLLSIAGLIAITAAMLAFRERLDKAHVALLYLLMVLAGSVVGGRGLGLALAGLAFLGFNWFFLQPYGTFTIADTLDWLVLATFLVVGGVAAQIVHRLREEAEDARARTAEVDRLAALGASTLALPRAADAVESVAAMIRSTLGLRSCRIHPVGSPEAGGELVGWVAQNGRAAGRLPDGTSRLFETAEPDERDVDVTGLLLPLSVRGRIVGVLEVDAEQPIDLDAAHRRFLAALSQYAAVGLERVRLESEAAAAAALREADRLKDAVLASVSHDLRTPLTTIKALASEMAAEGQDRALIIGEEADRLNRLVADLLDLSRLRAGAFPIRLELYPVDELIGAVLQRAAGVLGDRAVQVEMAEGGTLLVGKFDLAQTIRILVNLIENAHKYSPPGAPIGLTVTSDGERLTVAVLDRGPGVPEPERDRIFEPFYRPRDRAVDVGSAGLGLAIARWLAEAQGGTLSYAPRSGGGSRFLLTLPAVRLDQMEASL